MQIVAEYAAVLARPELKIRKGLRLQLRQLIENHTRAVTPSRLRQVTSDPADNMFVECADAARADYLITGNQRHFPTWTEVLEVIRKLGYRKTCPNTLRLANCEDWQEKPDALAAVSTEAVAVEESHEGA